MLIRIFIILLIWISSQLWVNIPPISKVAFPQFYILPEVNNIWMFLPLANLKTEITRMKKPPPQNYKNESNIFISEAKDMLIVSIEINFMGFFNAVIFRDPTSYFSLVLLAKHVTDYIVFVNEKQREWLTITGWGNTCSNSIVSKLKQHPWMFGVLSDLFCCWHE